MKTNNLASRREFLKAMPTQDLDMMLQAELRKDDIDDELVRLILDILEERESDYPVETSTEVTAAVEKYTAYLDGLETTPAKSTRKWSAVLKVASILIAVGVLIFVVPQAAKADSLFEMLARWTDSIFEFFSPGDDHQQPEYVFETDHPGLQKIYDAVVELGVTDPVVPMWVPEGYELEDIKIDEWPTETTLYAAFKKNEHCINFTLIIRGEGTPFQHPKDEQDAKIYEVMGVEHYVISNNGKWTSAWITQKTECVIVTDCQEEEVYKILKSIYTMEAY